MHPLLASALILLALVGLSEAHINYECRTHMEITGTPTKRSFMTSCYVQTDAGWMRWDEYKATIVAREGLAAGGDQ